MNKIKLWLANHSISAKTAASGWLFVVGMFYAVPPFHDYVMNAYAGLPKGIHGFIASVVIPGLIFWKTQKRTTITAEVAPGESATAAAAATVTETPKQ